MYFVYVLKSKQHKKSYVGISKDVKRRLKEHNAGKNYYTKRYKPWKVLYIEKHDTIKNARQREIYFKSASGRRFLRRNIFKQ